MRGICSAFDGIFLYNRSNNTKNEVKMFIPKSRGVSWRWASTFGTYQARVSTDSPARRANNGVFLRVLTEGYLRAAKREYMSNKRAARREESKYSCRIPHVVPGWCRILNRRKFPDNNLVDQTTCKSFSLWQRSIMHVKRSLCTPLASFSVH